MYAGIGGEESFYFQGIGIVDPFQLAPGFPQAVAHAVNMAVLQSRSGENKVAPRDDRRRFSFGGVVHAVFFMQKKPFLSWLWPVLAQTKSGSRFICRTGWCESPRLCEPFRHDVHPEAGAGR
ncbi:hypothetical protein [Paenibacillus chitinolyticus]